tara:strand:- start:5014 stop:5178 length:165 start_codon:yes stop_codon:yes gene_type:complete
MSIRFLLYGILFGILIIMLIGHLLEDKQNNKIIENLKLYEQKEREKQSEASASK